MGHKEFAWWCVSVSSSKGMFKAFPEEGEKYLKKEKEKMEFEIPKSIDDLTPAKIAPTGVYSFAISRTEILPNKAATGTNLEIDLTLIDDPQYEGVRQTLYSALPNPSDQGKMTKQGQPMTDFKLERLSERAESLGGGCVGTKVNIPEAGIVQATLEKLMGENGEYNRLQENTITPKKASGKKLS